MANPNGPWPTVTRWKPEILAAAKKYGVDPSILAAVVQHESGGREGLTSSAGAQGLTQFMPGTAATYHVNVSPGHALSQIEGTAHYLKDLGINSNPLKALAAYGAGPGNIPGGMGYARADLAISKNYKGLDGQTIAAPSTPGASGTRTRTVPGVDNSAARRDLIAQFVMQGGPSNDNALIGLASGLQGAQDTPSKTVRVAGSRGDSAVGGMPGGSSAPSGSGNYPLGKHGKIIGVPYQGTHGKAFNVSGGSDNWQSENAVDIAIPIGTPVYAVADGTLGNTGSLGQGGRFAGLRTNLIGANNSWYYAHLSKLASGIRAGAHVQKGQLLGWSGEANGVAHLHFAQENGNPQSSL